jgi:hypothetical protein
VETAKRPVIREVIAPKAPSPQPSPLKEQNRVVMVREGKITDAHRSSASQTSPLKAQNRVVMLREGRRGTG